LSTPALHALGLLRAIIDGVEDESDGIHYPIDAGGVRCVSVRSRGEATDAATQQ